MVEEKWDGKWEYQEHKKYFGHIKGTRCEIIPNLWLGDFIDAEEIGENPEWQIFAILDYPENECPREPESSRVCSIFRNRYDMEDAGVDVGFGGHWTESQDLRVNTEILDMLVMEILEALTAGKKVLIHCVGGVHRSPLVVVWFLRATGVARDIDEAYDMVIAKRPEVERRAFWIPDEDPPRAEDFD